MQVNNMSHMAEIFNTPLLPYKEFLVTHGKHGAALMEGGKLGDHYHARYEFPCGTEVSVISGPLFYCSPDAPYEYRINAEEPVGHQTDEELYILLTRIVAGERPRANDWIDDREKDDFHRLAVDEAHRDLEETFKEKKARIHQKAVDAAHPK